MFRTHVGKPYHAKLKQNMQAAHFVVDPDGMCFGYAMMAMQAILLRDIAAFDLRASMLHEMPAEKIANFIDETFNESLIKKRQFNAFREFYIDAYAYYSGVSLYQSRFHYPDLFSSNLSRPNQDIGLMSQFVMPRRLRDQGGMVEAGKFYGMYSLPELQIILQSLLAYLKLKKVNYPAAFLFKSSDHALVLGYDPDQDHWTYMEVHHGTSKIFSINRLATEINHKFSANDYTAASIDVFTTGNHAEELRQIIAEWKKQQTIMLCHQVNAERIGRIDSLGISLLYLAVVNNDLQRVEEVLKLPTARVDQANYLHITPLMYTVIFGNKNILSALLSHPTADVNAVFTEGTSLLIFAVRNNHPDCLRLLLNQPAINVNYRRPDGAAAIHQAAYKGNTRCLHELLQHKEVDPNLPMLDGDTALHIAVMQCYQSCVRELLAHPKTRVNLVNNSGQTPLMLAATYGFTEIAKLILEKDPQTANALYKNSTVADIARYNGFHALADLIESYSQRTSSQSSTFSAHPVIRP